MNCKKKIIITLMMHLLLCSPVLESSDATEWQERIVCSGRSGVCNVGTAPSWWGLDKPRRWPLLCQEARDVPALGWRGRWRALSCSSHGSYDLVEAHQPSSQSSSCPDRFRHVHVSLMIQSQSCKHGNACCFTFINIVYGVKDFPIKIKDSRNR